MPEDSVGQVSELPPPYDDQRAPLTGSSRTSSTNLSQHQPNSGYAPVQYNLAGQDPLEFYEALIDASNHPSEIFCRMADALFFYMDRRCNQFRGTQHIEPAKIAWLGVALGHDMEVSMAVEQHLPSLYDAASIPYAYNHTQAAVLDRRGHLHLCVFEVCADPEYAQKKWNKILNILKLHDPLTNLPFPTPIPCSAFPSVPDFLLNQVYTDWQIETALQVSRPTSNSSPTQYRGESTRNGTLHISLTAQVQHAVPIARQAAFQSMQQQHDNLQRIRAVENRAMQLGTSQNLQARTLELARMVAEVDEERNSGQHHPGTVQIPQMAPIARLVAFQTVQQLERLQVPVASNSTVTETPQDSQAAPSQASGSSREEVDRGQNNGLQALHQSESTAQVQKAVSIARRAAFQTAQQVEKPQNIQAPRGDR